QLRLGYVHAMRWRVDAVIGRPRREAALVGAGMAVLYLVTATAVHSESDDAVNFARGIVDGKVGKVLHPHHLLWGVLGWLSDNVARAFGHHGDAVPPVQALN